MTNPFAFGNATAPAPTASAPAQPPASAPVAAPATLAIDTPPTAPAAAPTPAGDDPFSAPAPQAARGPRVRDMYGRLLLVIPHKLEEDLPNRLQPGTTQDRLTADVIILDGGEIQYGGKPEATPPVPHTKTVATPFKSERMFLSQRGLISQCREALAKRLQGQPGMVLGRLTTGEAKEAGQNAPFLLSPPTDEDKALARQYLAQVDPFA
ncbi:hypothetical protein [Amycolatopsis jiangsuensis]|uniref:Uncharacterized protein n=1 Tax=Amycolatopsis jiangsuensis TaxID=1181879 RepID=A0A840J8R1_9PSEU|nr:hypothetical protein [Amycolatopsis jiangsuensis]MBB4689802.1 hypothetical protein [Amycolatopsis jiangsuensis]